MKHVLFINQGFNSSSLDIKRHKSWCEVLELYNTTSMKWVALFAIY